MSSITLGLVNQQQKKHLTHMNFIVGSGPSGIACAYALATGGRSITILDTGLTLEPERETVKAALARRDKRSWARSEISFLRGALPSRTGQTKLAYGSDFPYRNVPRATEVVSTGLSLRGSYARGGLSNIWGGVILPYRQDDLVGWPITETELGIGYAAVFKFLPLAAQLDPLVEQFPLYTDRYVSLPQSRQTIRLIRSLERNRAKLNACHVFFGGSRLAVDTTGTYKQDACVVCGQCLHGCPHELIYSSQQSLTDLEASGKVSYVGGVVVRSVEETGGSIRIHAQNPDGSPRSFEGERVFLAAGILNTTTIILRSQKLYDHPVNILDSQYFLFPMLQAAAAPDVAEEELHTLCQALVEIKDRDVSPHTVHLQIYSYNDYLAEILRQRLGILARVVPTNMILGRLLLVQGHLHSSHSGKIVATLKRSGSADALILEPAVNSATKDTVKLVIRKLRRLTTLTSAFPVASLVEITEPGRGCHSGGSFPMAHVPGPGQTDRLGRPYGMERTHIVDSTIFPNIPAPTITLTVMANAYRIGHEVAIADTLGAP
jgi:choline dehydrogenase-like flavoprotein